MPSVDGHQPSPLVSVSPDRFMSNCPTLPFNNKAMSHRSPLHSSDSLAPSLSSWSSSETESQTRCRSFTYPQGTFLPPATGLTLESSDHDPSPQVNAFLANPTVHRTHDNKGYQCPLCPQVFRDSYSTMSSNSSQHSHFSESASSPRRQVRTEALKEHLGVKHNLLPKHPCPFRNHTRCKSSPHGFVKCHRLANHIFDNALCRASAVAALDSASDDDASVVAADQGLIESIRWALGPNARTCTVAELADLFKARLVKRLDAASAASTLTTASASADKSGGKRRAKQARVVDMDDVENHAPRPATTSSSESSASEASNKRRRTLATTSEVEFTRFWNQLHSDLPSSSLPTSANDNVITFTLSPPTSPTSTLDWFSDMISNSTSTDTVSTCPFPSSLASTSPCPFQSLQIPTPQPSPSPLVLPTILPNSQPALMDPLMLTTAAAFDMPPAHALAPPPPVPTSAVASTLASTLDCGLFYPPVTQVAQISPFALPPALPVPSTTPSFSDFDLIFHTAATICPSTIAPALTYAPSACTTPPVDHDALLAYLFGPPTPPTSPAVGEHVRLTSIKDQVLAGSANEMGEQTTATNEGVDPVLLALFGMEPEMDKYQEKEECDKAKGLERCLSLSDVLLSEFL